MGELVARGVGIEQFKQELVAAIKHKAKWRSERAGQYRSDRNARSAAALEALARALDAMPTNHPRILRVWALKQRHCGPESVFAEQDVLRTYGLHRAEDDGDPISFLDDLRDSLDFAAGVERGPLGPI